MYGVLVLVGLMQVLLTLTVTPSINVVVIPFVTDLETIKDDAWMKQVHYAMTEEERINANLEKQAE